MINRTAIFETLISIIDIIIFIIIIIVAIFLIYLLFLKIQNKKKITLNKRNILLSIKKKIPMVNKWFVNIIPRVNIWLCSDKIEKKSTENNKTNTVDLLSMVKGNIWVILSSCIVFALLLVFFIIAFPIVPFTTDDWADIGLLTHYPLPGFNQLVPARVFPDVLITFAGLFTGYIVNPFFKDFIASASFTIALNIALFVTVFYISLYKLFFALSKDKLLSVFSGLLTLCLYFSFFKTQSEGSLYMLRADDHTTCFAYTLPSIYNSILVCILMYYSAKGIHISFNTLGRKTFISLTTALYFAIFSVLYSGIILAAYCFFVLIINIIQKIKLRNEFFTLLIIIGFFVYMYFEYTGDRAQDYNVSKSFFSLEYINRCQNSIYFLKSLIRQINIEILFVSITVNSFALILLLLNIKKDRSKPIIKTGLISLLSSISLIPAMIFITAKISPYHASRLMFMYCIFFYYILFTILSLIYIMIRIRKLIIFLPLVLLCLFMKMADSRVPYMDQEDWRRFYSDRPMRTPMKRELYNMWLEQIVSADRNGEESVTIRIPKSSDPNGWPILTGHEWRFSHTLFALGITSRRMNIIYQPDQEITESLY